MDIDKTLQELHSEKEKLENRHRGFGRIAPFSDEIPKWTPSWKEIDERRRTLGGFRQDDTLLGQST